MSERNVAAGDTIVLQACFKNDLNDPVEATNVLLHIFDPTATDLTDLGQAVASNLVPTYIGEGIFEYEYTVPAGGPEGTWYDVWEGDLELQSLTANLSFQVVTDGVICAVDGQLNPNNEVTVTLTSAIAATDGTTLEGGHVFNFLTELSPLYSNIRKVRLEAGGFLGGVDDYTIQSAIHEASLDTEVLLFATTIVNQKLFEFARYQYVTCLASSMLIDNTTRRLLKSKTLADLSVSYDNNGIADFGNKLRECLDRWEPQLISGGGARATKQPKGVVKGELDPDRPVITRMWVSTESGTLSRRIPAANTRELPRGYRRARRTYRKKTW